MCKVTSGLTTSLTFHQLGRNFLSMRTHTRTHTRPRTHRADKRQRGGRLRQRRADGHNIMRAGRDFIITLPLPLPPLYKGSPLSLSLPLAHPVTTCRPFPPPTRLVATLRKPPRSCRSRVKPASLQTAAGWQLTASASIDRIRQEEEEEEEENRE